MQEGEKQEDFDVHSIFVIDCGPWQAGPDQADKVPSEQQMQNTMDWQINWWGVQESGWGSRWLLDRDLKEGRRVGRGDGERDFGRVRR